MVERFTLGIDLGGTNLKAGICDAQGSLVAQHAIETKAELGFKGVLARMVALVDELVEMSGKRRTEISAIGVGAPGPLSRRGFDLQRAQPARLGERSVAPAPERRYRPPGRP